MNLTQLADINMAMFTKQVVKINFASVNDASIAKANSWRNLYEVLWLERIKNYGINHTWRDDAQSPES